ncbi:hypothetical protein ACIU43_11705 [Klebsiella pneumoniae]
MTSKFSIENRELLQRISSGEAVVGVDFGNLIVRELAAFRLAAMDSEPMAWIHEDELPDGYPYDSMFPFSKVDIVRMFPVFAPQPPLVPSDVLNHLEHEANHVTAWHHMDEHSCKVNRRDLLTLINAIRDAQPAPVAPACTCPSGDGSLRWPCPVHAGNSPTQSDCCPAQNSVSPAQDGNSPATSDNWQVKAEKLAEMHGMSFVMFRHGEAPQCADPTKVVISFTDKGLGRDTLPAAPQEVKP